MYQILHSDNCQSSMQDKDKKQKTKEPQHDAVKRKKKSSSSVHFDLGPAGEKDRGLKQS